MAATIKPKFEFKVLTSNPIYQNYSLIIIPLISILGCIVIAALVTIPQVFKILDTNQKIDETRAEQLFYKTKIANLQRIDTKLYRQNLDTALIALPPDKDIPSAIGDILNLLSGSGLQLLGMSFNQTGQPIGSLENFQTRVDVLGDVNQLKKFIELSQDSSRVLKIDGIEITSSATSDQIQATFNMLAFYQAIPVSVSVPLNQQVNLLTEADRQVLEKVEVYSRNRQVIESTASAVEVGKADPFN
jgi:Tfp pilus assembly protein PilO